MYKLFDEIIEEEIVIDARDITEISLNNGKIYVENMDGVVFITEKITAI